MILRILGLATAPPPLRMPQELAAQWAAELSHATAAQTEFLHNLFQRAGVRHRASVLLDTNPDGSLTQHFFKRGEAAPSTEVRMERYVREAIPLAVRGSRAALDDAGLTPKDVTHLITVTCTGFVAPGLDRAISIQLGLRPTVTFTNVGFMGCAASFNALAIAKPIIEANPDAIVLIAAVELSTLHFRFENDMEQLVANSLFADGAAAMVVGGGTSDDDWRLQAVGSYVIPDTTEALGWRICDHGFRMNLSPKLPSLINGNLRAWLEPWLSEHSIHLGDVLSWAIHPGGPKILDAAAAALGIPLDRVSASAHILAEHGNMSSPTILYILDELRRSQAPRPCVAVGFGPGVVAHAALFR